MFQTNTDQVEKCERRSDFPLSDVVVALRRTSLAWLRFPRMSEVGCQRPGSDLSRIFCPSPPQIGYMNGLALTIVVGQLPKLLGFSVDANGFVAEFFACPGWPRAK